MIDTIKAQLPDTVIFGGMIRDFALAGPRSFNSDVDLVSNALDSEVYGAIREFSPKKNKFGGYRFRGGKWQFDIWALTNTWAFQQELVEGGSLTDLLKTTFFNVDSAIFHLTKRSVCVSDRFSHGVQSRLLEINLEENPSPQSMAHRAINMAIDYDLAIGPRLSNYIIRHTTNRPTWLSETLRSRLLSHVESTEEPFAISVQGKIPIPD
jgi:hypothetical protein